jgi:hypothetical protein
MLSNSARASATVNADEANHSRKSARRAGQAEPRPQPLPNSTSDTPHDVVGELVAQEAPTVQRLPDRRSNLLDLVGPDCRVEHAGGIAPGREAPLGRARDRAPRREPERQLVGGVEVEPSANRPRLDERASLPQRRADVGLNDVDAGGKLELGRCLDLRMHAAQAADDLDEPVAACTLAQRRTRQTARAYLIPSDVHAGGSLQAVAGATSR